MDKKDKKLINILLSDFISYVIKYGNDVKHISLYRHAIYGLDKDVIYVEFNKIDDKKFNRIKKLFLTKFMGRWYECNFTMSGVSDNTMIISVKDGE